MAVSARVHLLQIELSGDKIKLHGTCVRELSDGTEKANVGTCNVELEITAASVKPFIDQVKAELKRLAALPKSSAELKRFAGLTIQ